MPLLNATLIFAEVDLALGGNASTAALLAGVADVIAERFGPTAPAGRHAEWYASSAILAVELATVLAAIAIKIWLGKAWMFRRTEVAGSTYLSPNFGFSWQVMIAVFLAGLQVACWFLVRFSQGDNIPGFYTGIVATWLGFLWAALLCAWALAVSRCREVASAGPHGLRFYHSAACVHAVFVGFPAISLAATTTLGILLNQRYNRMWSALVAVRAALAAAAASTAAGVAVDEAGLTEQTQAALAHFDSFFRCFRASFYELMASDLVAWIVCLIVSVPYMLRLWTQLRDAGAAGGGARGAARGRRRQLVLAFGAACAAVFLLSTSCVVYALLVCVMVGFHVHPYSFPVDAYNVVTVALLIFVGLGVPTSALALAHALFQLRHHRRTWANPPARSSAAAGTARDPAATFGSGPGSPGGKGSLRRGGYMERRDRDRGRFVITIERVVDLDREEELEMGETVAGRDVGEEKAGWGEEESGK